VAIIKPTYSLFSNIKYSTVNLWRAGRRFFLMVALGTAMKIAMPFTGILTPKIVIDEITAGAEPARFVFVIAALAAALIAIHFAEGYTNLYILVNVPLHIGIVFSEDYAEKLMRMDYENREKPGFIKMKDRAAVGLAAFTPGNNFLRTWSNLLANAGSLILFGGVIALIHPLIIALLALNVAVNALLVRWRRRFDENRRDYVANVEKKCAYIGVAVRNTALGKDIRLYSMLDWLRKRFDGHVNEKKASDVKSAFKGVFTDLGDGLMILLRDGFAYAFLTYLLIDGRIGLGDFVMAFAAIGGLAGWINGAVNEMNELLRASVELNDRRQMLNFPDKPDALVKTPLPRSDTGPEIRLINVAYSYPGYMDGQFHDNGTASPGVSEPVLKNISIRIKPGERIAVVGVKR
jgi:ATP-binding cassette subfamily B protein